MKRLLYVGLSVGLAMIGLVIVRIVCAAVGYWVPSFQEAFALFFCGIGGAVLTAATAETSH